MVSSVALHDASCAVISFACFNIPLISVLSQLMLHRYSDRNAGNAVKELKVQGQPRLLITYKQLCLCVAIALPLSIPEGSFRPAPTDSANFADLLQDLASPTALAKRDQEWKVLQVKNLVVGDLIQLKAGDVIPADAKVHARIRLCIPPAFTSRISWAAQITSKSDI